MAAVYLLGDNWERVEQYVGYFQYVVIAAIVIAVGWFFFSRLTHRGTKPAPASDLAEGRKKTSVTPE
jgi:hypothetical protein